MSEMDYRRERIAFLGLSTLKGIGFWTLHKICEDGGSFDDSIKNPEKYKLENHFSSLMTEGTVIDSVKLLIWDSGKELYKRLRSKGINLIFHDECTFPTKLKAIPDSPKWIFVEGNIDSLEKLTCTIVGTRNATDDGIFLTRLIVTALAEQEIVTVSGLANGIDQVAHQQSIRYGIPTIAVLGTGILKNYPSGSEQLRASILEYGGAIVTEYLPDQSFSAENFVRRNRLQAALGDTLIPCEWAIKSGTAHTVKYAYTYGKKIINIHLPLRFNLRPEIDFSVKKYSAMAIELPKDLDLLIDEIIHPKILKDRIKEKKAKPSSNQLDIFSEDDNEAFES
jgi:DNA protecting protein DprA